MDIEDKQNVKVFSEKYEGAGGVIGKKLIESFFSAVTSLIPDDVSNAIELGCGPGYSTEKIHIAKPDIELEASDIDPDLVSVTQNRVPDVKTSVESIYSVKKDDESADLVFVLEVLEHLDKPEDALREVHRITRRYAIISVPREPIWRILNMLRGKYLKDFGNTPGHLNHWSQRSIQKFVSPLFEVKKIVSPLPWTVLLLIKHEKNISNK